MRRYQDEKKAHSQRQLQDMSQVDLPMIVLSPRYEEPDGVGTLRLSSSETKKDENDFVKKFRENKETRVILKERL